MTRTRWRLGPRLTPADEDEQPWPFVRWSTAEYQFQLRSLHHQPQRLLWHTTQFRLRLITDILLALIISRY